jgi:hypothetical protein
MTDLVNHPRHYNIHPSGIECIEIKRGLSPGIGDAVKYIWRDHAKGNPLQDQQKAAFYLRDAMSYPAYYFTPRPEIAVMLRQVAEAEPAGSLRAHFFHAIADERIGHAYDLVIEMIRITEEELRG